MRAPIRRRPIPLLALLGALAAAPAQAQRIAEVQVAPRYLRMRQDAIAQVSATAYDLNGMPLDVPFRWRSSNINVATVDSAGNVRAVGPGNALVFAWTEELGRRRMGQVTVQVMREGGAPGFGYVPAIPPPGAMPGMPPGAAPEVPAPAMPPGVPNRRELDSTMRASIDCNQPMINAVNPLRACWDERAVVRDSSVEEPERPGPDRCPHGASPVTLLVRISETGDVADVQLIAPSSCPEFTDRVVTMARRLRYTPAQRGGKPVSSWRAIRPRGRETPRP